MEGASRTTNAQLRRNRKPVSCSPCRQRKLGCDRALPACGNCINRGDIVSCVYVSRRLKVQRQWQDAPETSPNHLQDKVDKLEQLVMQFLDKAAPTTKQPNGNGDASLVSKGILEPPSPVQAAGDCPDSDELSPISATKNIQEDTPVMTIAADYRQSVTIDEAHWAQLLNGIGEVRGYLQAQQEQYEEQRRRISMLSRRSPDDPGPTLLFGSATVVSRSAILTQLPSRYACDTMVRRYFSSLDPALYILHGPTFHAQYEDHWKDKSQTSIVWLALLFAILRIAVNDWTREGDEPLEYRGKCQDMAVTFRNSFTDCLIAADYMQPHEYLIEAMILHLYAEYGSTRDCKPSVWVLTGMIVRLAMRTGYHQSSQPLLQRSPFHDEMRRRSWAFIRQADVLFSFQVGLPSMIKTCSIDENLPRNFYDDENFHEHCKTLPTNLPDTEPTPISYLISKSKLAFGFARALKEMNREQNITDERVLEIDSVLRRAYANVPDYYKLQNMSEQSQDPMPLIFARFTLANIHHKSLCVVHGRYLEAARLEEKYRYSRKTCLDSAMSLLRFQAMQHQDIVTNGKVQSLTRYQTSLTIHDYLLAATIIGAELCLSKTRGDVGNVLKSRCALGGPNSVNMLTALDTSANIFSQMRDRSIEAYKASDVLGALLKKLQAPSTPSPALFTGPQQSKVARRERTVPPHRYQAGITGRLQTTTTDSTEHYNARVHSSQLRGVSAQGRDLRPASERHNIMPTRSEVDDTSQEHRSHAPSGYLPAWINQQRRQIPPHAPNPVPLSSGYQAPFDWSVPSYADMAPPSSIMSQEVASHEVAHRDDENLGMEITGGSLGADPWSQFLDLSDPVTSLWKLNSGRDFMDLR